MDGKFKKNYFSEVESQINQLEKEFRKNNVSQPNILNSNN